MILHIERIKEEALRGNTRRGYFFKSQSSTTSCRTTATSKYATQEGNGLAQRGIGEQDKNHQNNDKTGRRAKQIIEGNDPSTTNNAHKTIHSTSGRTIKQSSQRMKKSELKKKNTRQ